MEDSFSKTVGLLLILLTSVDFLFLNMNYQGLPVNFHEIF